MERLLHSIHCFARHFQTFLLLSLFFIMSAASPTASSSSSRYQYRCTNSHHKTLNVLGKVKNFAKLSLEELVGYCGLMKNDNGCQSAADAAEALTSRFGWASSSRRADIETAWKSLESADGGTGEVLELDVEALSQKEIFVDKDDQNLTDKLVEPIISSSSIPIIIKNNAWERKVLLCEIDDNDFNISGDSGAVGRISVDPLSLLLDVKGAVKIFPSFARKMFYSDIS